MKGSVDLRSTAEDGASRQRPPYRERWITIGTVGWPWFVFEMGSGTPGGYHILWAGKTAWCQPWQFRRAEHLCWAIERRLQLSRLQWVAMASAVPRVRGRAEVWVLVKRSSKLEDRS